MTTHLPRNPELDEEFRLSRRISLIALTFAQIIARNHSTTVEEAVQRSIAALNVIERDTESKIVEPPSTMEAWVNGLTKEQLKEAIRLLEEHPLREKFPS